MRFRHNPPGPCASAAPDDPAAAPEPVLDPLRAAPLGGGPYDDVLSWPSAGSGSDAGSGTGTGTGPRTGTAQAVAPPPATGAPATAGSPGSPGTAGSDEVATTLATPVVAAPAGSGPAVGSGPVFVDVSGRRARHVRRASWAVGTACALYTTGLVLSLAGATPFAPRTLLPLPGVPSSSSGHDADAAAADTMADPGSVDGAYPGGVGEAGTASPARFVGDALAHLAPVAAVSDAPSAAASPAGATPAGAVPGGAAVLGPIAGPVLGGGAFPGPVPGPVTGPVTGPVAGSPGGGGAGPVDVPSHPAPEPPRDSTAPEPPAPPPPPLQTRTGRALKWTVSALLIAALGLGSWQLADALLKKDNRQDNPGTSQPKGGDLENKDQPAKPLAIRNAVEYYPDGNPQHTDQVELTYDGKPDTAWVTKGFNEGPDLNPAFKQGVGIVYDLGEKTKVSAASIALRYGGPHTTVTLYATDRLSSSDQLGSMKKLAATTTSDTRADLAVKEPVATRYVLVWLTAMPYTPGGEYGRAGYRQAITDVSFTG
ncbi:hypothetical protein [Streptomyces sp. URMC 123]|uniref:hypothetical protein n=1 Tax=Streptomyces sp. URMC 123 TaxID=3423403 RepID=UPI003F1CD5C5